MNTTNNKFRLIREWRHIHRAPQRTVVSIGSFDGVHAGHQHMLQKSIRHAQRLKLLSVAVTFEPQPKEFFSGEQAPARLMRIREKMQSLLDLGVDNVVCLQFNTALRRLSADQFVETILVHKLRTRYLVVGDDFRFGCDRSGDYAMLVAAGKKHDFEVQKMDTVQIDGQRVSSTLVREFVEQGNFKKASKLLGRPFSVSGRVVYGEQLGKKLGFPTANVHLHRYRVPLTGVFAVRVHVNGNTYQGAANVGVRPTIGDLIKPILEVHLLDFSGDLYGQRIEVEFAHKIRDEKKFSTLDELATNIKGDIDKTRSWFTKNT